MSTSFMPSLSVTDPIASHKIVGSSDVLGHGILGYYTRSDVGSALDQIHAIDPKGIYRVEPHNMVLAHDSPLRSSDVEWIVNNHGELGVKIGEQMFFLYKGESLMYTEPGMTYRAVEKREFGASCRAPDESRYKTSDQPGEREYDLDNRHSGWKPINIETAFNEVQYFNKDE
jgi:hypothetical protein